MYMDIFPSFKGWSGSFDFDNELKKFNVVNSSVSLVAAAASFVGCWDAVVVVATVVAF